MGYGLDIKIPTDSDDTTLPYADDDDALMVPGSLLLIDPSHSTNPMGALGAPAPRTSVPVPNIAWKHVVEITGTGDATSLAASLYWDVASDVAAAVKFEKTGKGGIHGMISATNNTGAGQGASIMAPSALQAYLYANLGHSYYFSRWSRVTRKGSDTAGATRANIFNSGGSAGGDFLLRFLCTGIVPAANAAHNLGVSSIPGPNTVGNTFDAIGVQGFTGNAPAAAANITMGVANWGTTNPDGFSGRYNTEQSSILYRTYLEDLTVSGRTYAQVQAADYSLFQGAMAAGGRFAGDTFSDPATVLP